MLLLVTFFGRMCFITAGYHRYFAHRSYKLRRSAHRDCARLGRGVQRGGAPSRGSAWSTRELRGWADRPAACAGALGVPGRWSLCAAWFPPRSWRV